MKARRTSRRWKIVRKQAFAFLELEAVRDWVWGGGSLLLVTDHYPSGRASGLLAGQFGVHVSGGWTDDPDHRRSLPGHGPVFGYLEFSRRDGSLGEPGSVSLLRLSPTAIDYIPRNSVQLRVRSETSRDFNPCPGCDRVPAAGRSQGLAMEFGRGRVVVLREMGIPIENREFTVNVLRWLAREL